MKQPSQIDHKGRVALVGRNFVRVDIEVLEACGSCSSRKACAMGSSEKREIMVYTDEAQSYSIGEVVEVSAKQSMGVMAVILCYIVPLVVLVTALAIATVVGLSDGIAAILSLASTSIYFGLLALFRDRLSKKVIFKINKI